MDDLPKDNESDREKVAGEVSEDRRAMVNHISSTCCFYILAMDLKVISFF